MHFEIFRNNEPTATNCWYWRLKAKNNRIIADGAEGYSGLSKAHRAVGQINKLFVEPLPVMVVDNA